MPMPSKIPLQDRDMWTKKVASNNDVIVTMPPIDNTMLSKVC